jgi:putative transposase
MISEEQRRMIIKLYEKKKTQMEISSLLDIPQSTVSYWIVRHKRTGDIKAMQKSGRPRRLTASQLEQLRSVLHDKPPVRYGGESFGWTTKLALQYVKDQFGIPYGMRQVQKTLHKLDLRLITPRSEHAKASFAARTVFRMDFKKNSKRSIWVPAS